MRQIDGERAPESRARAEGRDAAAVKLDQVTDDGQPETEPTLGPRADVLELTEAVEDLGQELGRDPPPRVAHDESNARRQGLEPDVDAPAARGELQGVGQEVQDHLLQSAAVAPH